MPGEILINVDVSVDVRIFHPDGAIIETYALDSAGDLAAWGWNARHFVTSLVSTKTKMMTEDEASEFAVRRSAAFAEKRRIIAEINAGRA